MRCNCIVCNRELKDVIYSLSNMPKLVQHLPTKETVENDTGMKLDLYECDGCGLVQFSCDPVFYYKDVIRAVGLSTTLKELRYGQYTYLFDKYDLKSKKILEVGCGAGEFLALWDKYDVVAAGVEHSEELVAKAKENGLNVYHGFVDEDYIAPDGPYDVITSFNYLEHQPKPSEMVRGMYNNLSEGGIGLITVPSFDYFIEKASYYEFMRDHIAYYSEVSLRNLFELNGFEVLETSRFNGDTAQMIVKKRKKSVLPAFEAQRVFISNELNKYVKENGLSKIAVWGASHQALTLLATIDNDFDIQFIIDSSPIKEGYYSPVSHLEIKSPKKVDFSELDLIIIMAPAFSHEIANQVREQCEFKHILAIKNDEVLKL